MRRRRVDDRARAVVRCDRPLEGLRKRGDLASLRDATDPADVEDDDLSAPAREQVAERGKPGERLADGERRPRCALDLGERVRTGDPHRILDPRRLELVECARDPACGGNVPERVELDHHVDRRADCGADLPERLERPIEVGGTNVVAETRLGIWVERPDLHPGDALGEQVAGQLVCTVEERIEVFVRPLRLRMR